MRMTFCFMFLFGVVVEVFSLGIQVRRSRCYEICGYNVGFDSHGLF